VGGGGFAFKLRIFRDKLAALNLFGVIHVPDFYLQAALRLEPELSSRPVALLDDLSAKASVLQATDAARRAGVVAGLTSTQAMARCPGVVLKARSRPREEAAAAMLLQCAYCFSPNIEATADGVCTLDLQGLPVAGQWEAWARKILDALAQLQLQAQIGVAQTPLLAWQAARRARPFLFVGDAEPFVAALPLESLESAGPVLEILQSWGVRTVGAFLALGKENIAERLGPEAAELFDLASSRRARPLKRVVPAAAYEEEVEFEQPVETLEPLLFVLRRLIEQLARRLEMAWLVAAELNLRLGLCSGAACERLFVIPAPISQVETLFRVLRTYLETVRADSPIASVRLSAKPGRPATHQFGLFDATLRDPNQFHETLGRLTALLGPGRAGTPCLADSHRPEDFRMEPDALAAPRPQEREDNEGEPPAGPALRRFRPPMPATVEMRSGRPALLRSAAYTGPIARARGPWRLSGQWWDERAWERDEWEVQTRDGVLYRLVRQKEEWFVEGLFD
jgi:protein ImuB